MALLSSTSPLSFSHNGPPCPLSLELSQEYPSVIPSSAPSHTSWRCSGMTPRQQEMGICNGHFSLTLAPSLAPCFSHTLYVSRPHPSFKCTHLEQVTDHLKHLECGEAITLPSGHLQRPCHCSVLVFKWTFVYNHYSSHSRSHHSAASVGPRLTSLLRLVWQTQPIS